MTDQILHPNLAEPARTIDTRARIGDLVLEMPAAVRVFEALNIDYCCGGQRSLADACAHAGQDLREVLAWLHDLRAPVAGEGPQKWREAPLDQLMDHIVATHHAFTRSELDRVAPLMEKVLHVHGGHHPELERIAGLFAALAAELRPHLEKEEQILFPFIRGLVAGDRSPRHCGSVQNPIRVMVDEHERAGEILRGLRELTEDYIPPEDACASYRSLFFGLRSLEEDLHQHIYLENHILFPRAGQLEAAL
jgi:regulator of cell morphogenesis and NO signaling